MTIPPATGRSRPAPPPLRLPRPVWRPGGFITSLVLHAVILLLVFRYGVEMVLGGGDDRLGPRGGGGGAGGAVHLVDLPAAAAPAPAAPVQQPQVHTPPPQPDPVATLPPRTLQPLSMTVAPVVAPIGNGTAGQGPGTGGGTGSGAGPGVGSDSGPGRGGNGGYISQPYARTVLLPPKCVRGDFTLTFWVEADGSVSRMSVEPQVKDGDCRREVLDRMKGFQFLPARTRDGQPVPSMYRVTMHQ